MCKVLINGNWIGFTDKPKELISEYKNNRRQGLIHLHNSIYWDHMNYMVQIFTDGVVL